MKSPRSRTLRFLAQAVKKVRGKRANRPIERKSSRPKVTDDQLALSAPSYWQLALEARAPLELWASVLSFPILRQCPRGDGHPVLVFPGLAAGDFSTFPMRRFLESLGYPTYGWMQGLNAGPRHGVLAGCKERIEELFEMHGRKLSLVGWSLGGLYAREMAKTLPGMVRQVITLGSPFTGNPHATNAWRLFELLCGHRVDDPLMQQRLREAPPVPTTSIYSKTDGIVAWQCSVQSPAQQTENIELSASHFGIGMNPLALYALADRLAQKEGAWKTFHRKGLRALFFPKPHFA
jgi:pimeloyl-ACP methyl ester carboxylesterase